MEPDEPKPPDPVKLSDRSQRRKDEKDFNSYTIKCGFEKSLKIDHNYKEAFVKSVNSRVESISKGTHKLSILMNIFVRECLEKTKDPLKAVIPSFLTDKDTTFARQLMIGSEDFDRNNKPNPVVLEFLNIHENLIKCEKFKRFQGDRNSISRACEAYLTNYRTYLTEVFKGKQISFISLWLQKHGFDKSLTNDLRYVINGWELKKAVFPLPENLVKFVDFQRKLLRLDKTNKVSKSWIKKNYETVIVYYSVLSKYFKKHGEKQILIAPLNKIKNMFLHIDTDVFHGILKETCITNDSVKDIRNNKSGYFNEVFKISKLLTYTQASKNFYFSGTVMTDGTALNIIFKRPKIETEAQDLDRNDPCIRVIANDPGRSTLFCGIEQLENGNIKEYTFTRNYFHTISGAKKAVKNSNRWNLEMKGIYEQLAQTNSRNLALSEFLDYVKIVKENYDSLWSHNLKKRNSRQRFALYSGKKKAYDLFFKSLINPLDSRRTVIAYGDAGFASNSKFELSAPTTTLERECKKWFKTVKVDEFRTTKLDYGTGKTLCKVIEIKKNECDKQIRTVRGLLWYRKTNKVCKFINRDINAARNILRCYRTFPKRPEGFNRKDMLEEDPKPHYIYSKQELPSVTKFLTAYEDLTRFNSYFSI